MASKDGLQSSIEFTKFVITLDSALIAFMTGAAFLERITSPWERGLSCAGLVLLAVSLGAGVLTQMRAATMLSQEVYDLGDPHLRVPGAINVLGFAAGAIMLSGLAIYVLVLRPPEPKAEPAMKVIYEIGK